jgi:hypothetical protein
VKTGEFCLSHKKPHLPMGTKEETLPFVCLLDKTGILRSKKDDFVISSNALAEATLMIALSNPAEKEQTILMVMNFLKHI